jgi:hypothetical protein
MGVKTMTERIEAYGVKGMKSKPWRMVFPTLTSLRKWAEKNDAEVYGWRAEERERADA